MTEKFKLSEEAEKQVKAYADIINDCESGLEALSRKLKEAKLSLWKVIASEYPQVNESFNKAVFHHDTKELYVTKVWEKTAEQHQMETIVKEIMKDGVEEIITEKIEEKFNQE